MVSSGKIIEQCAIIKGIRKFLMFCYGEFFVEIFHLECFPLWIFHTHTLSYQAALNSSSVP